MPSGGTAVGTRVAVMRVVGAEFEALSRCNPKRIGMPTSASTTHTTRAFTARRVGPELPLDAPTTSSPGVERWRLRRPLSRGIGAPTARTTAPAARPDSQRKRQKGTRLPAAGDPAGRSGSATNSAAHVAAQAEPATNLAFAAASGERSASATGSAEPEPTVCCGVVCAGDVLAMNAPSVPGLARGFCGCGAGVPLVADCKGKRVSQTTQRVPPTPIVPHVGHRTLPPPPNARVTRRPCGLAAPNEAADPHYNGLATSVIVVLGSAQGPSFSASLQVAQFLHFSLNHHAAIRGGRHARA